MKDLLYKITLKKAVENKSELEQNSARVFYRFTLVWTFQCQRSFNFYFSFFFAKSQKRNCWVLPWNFKDPSCSKLWISITNVMRFYMILKILNFILWFWISFQAFWRYQKLQWEPKHQYLIFVKGTAGKISIFSMVKVLSMRIWQSWLCCFRFYLSSFYL